MYTVQGIARFCPFRLFLLSLSYQGLCRHSSSHGRSLLRSLHTVCRMSARPCPRSSKSCTRCSLLQAGCPHTRPYRRSLDKESKKRKTRIGLAWTQTRGNKTCLVVRCSSNCLQETRGKLSWVLHLVKLNSHLHSNSPSFFVSPTGSPGSPMQKAFYFRGCSGWWCTSGGGDSGGGVVQIVAVVIAVHVCV